MLEYVWNTYYVIVGPVLLGLLLSGLIFLLLGLALNSRKIPLERILLRSAGVVPLTLRIWLLPALMVSVVVNEVPAIESFRLTYLQLDLPQSALLIAFLLPQIGWFKLLRINLRFDSGLQDSIANIFVRLGEATVAYPQKIIDREFTKIKTEFLPSDHDLCVAKAYEFHRVEVARAINKKPYEEVIKLANKSVKIDHLMRFLGCEKFHYLMQKIQADRAIILPTWNHDNDRRKKPVSSRRLADRRMVKSPVDTDLRGSNSDRRAIPQWGRRRADSPYAHHFVLR